MVEGIPYIRIKTGSDQVYEEPNHNYLWATVVEATRGPINEPVFVTGKEHAKQLFGINLDKFFDNGGQGLYVIRAAAGDEPTAPNAVVPQFSEAKIKLAVDSYFKGFNGKIIKYDLTGENAPVEHDFDAEVTGVTPTVTYIKQLNSAVPADLADLNINDVYKAIYNKTLAQVDSESVVTGAGNAVTDVVPIVLRSSTPGTSEIRINSFGWYIRGGFKMSLSADGYKDVIIQGPTNFAQLVDKINKKCAFVSASLTESGKFIDDLLAEKEFTTYDYDNTASDCKGYKLKVTNFKTETTPLKLFPALINKLQTNSQFYAYPSVKFENGSNGYWVETATPDVYGFTGRIRNPTAPSTGLNEAGQKAHRYALQILENLRITGVFCLYPEPEIQEEYIYHSEKMSADDVCRWRYAVIGANQDDRAYLDNLVERAIGINNDYTIYLAQGARTIDGEEILPINMTQIWAGKRSGLDYSTSMFGGEASKILHAWSDVSNSVEELYDILPLTTLEENAIGYSPDEYIRLNEAGCVTLKREYNTVTFREGVTTSQKDDYSSEESVVNIVKYALNEVYDECYLYQGKNITSTLKSSLEESIRTRLALMQSHGSLVDVETDSLRAYDVEVILTPRSGQRIGRIYVNVKLTPVYALRQIEASVVVL